MKRLTRTVLAAIASFSVTAPALADCFNLAQHIPPGPFFGAAFQVDANTTVSLTPTQFWWDPTTPASGGPNAEMVPNACFGGPASLNLNNTNLTIQIFQREPNVKELQLNFCDFGGFENVSASPVIFRAFRRFCRMHMATRCKS